MFSLLVRFLWTRNCRGMDATIDCNFTVRALPLISSLRESQDAFDWKDLTVDKLDSLLSWYAEFSASSENWNQFGLFKLMHSSNGEIQLLIQTALNNEMDALDAKEAIVAPAIPTANTVAMSAMAFRTWRTPMDMSR